MQMIKLRKPEDPTAPLVFRVAKAIADSLFNLVQWCMVLSILEYARGKTDSVIVDCVSWVLKGALFFYIYALLISKVEIDIIPSDRRTKFWHIVADTTPNFLITMGLYILAQIVIDGFVRAIASLQPVG